MSAPGLPESIKATFEAAPGASIATCSRDGVPNVTILSKVYWVDEHHLALSFQFFNKTIRNVRENPFVNISIIDVVALQHWSIDMEYVRSETEGPIFDEMDMAIEAIASMTGMKGIFKLRAADIYRVHGYSTIPFAE